MATLTYSPKSYGLLITFSLIMLDSPMLLLSLSTWFGFCWMGLGDHPETFLLKALCCQSSPSGSKVVGGWWVVVACEIILSSPGTGGRGTLYFPFLFSHSHFPFPIPNSHFPFPIPQSQAQSQAQAQSQSQSLDNFLSPPWSN